MTRYENADAVMFVSPITGKDVEVSTRAFCAQCGYPVSHGRAATVAMTVGNFVKCKRCDCASLKIKHTAVEMINGEIIKLHR